MLIRHVTDGTVLDKHNVPKGGCPSHFTERHLKFGDSETMSKLLRAAQLVKQGAMSAASQILSMLLPPNHALL